MIDATRQRALLVEANASLEDAATAAASMLVSGRISGPVYPPNGGFTDLERAALEALPREAPLESALRKVIADAISSALFHTFAVIDGVGDPRAFEGQWLTYAVCDSEEDHDFLHEEFLEAYWDWRAIRPDPGWRLDMYEDRSPSPAESGEGAGG